MRITAGKNRGKRLLVPKTNLRPTTDKVRQAFFNIVGPLAGLSFLDLYAGSGAVGIGALSRGAAEAQFVDVSPAACQVIRKNLEAIGQSGEVVCCPVLNFIKRSSADKYDLIYVDPPYFSEKEKEGFVASRLAEILRAGGRLVIELSSREDPPVLDSFLKEKARVYGESQLVFYKNSKNGVEL